MRLKDLLGSFICSHSLGEVSDNLGGLDQISELLEVLLESLCFRSVLELLELSKDVLEVRLTHDLTNKLLSSLNSVSISLDSFFVVAQFLEFSLESGNSIVVDLNTISGELDFLLKNSHGFLEVVLDRCNLRVSIC